MRGGFIVFHEDVTQIKQNIKSSIGSKVRLEQGKGKQRNKVSEGVIDSVYPSVFTITLYGGTRAKRKVSYSYTDVLTKSVEITLCN